MRQRVTSVDVAREAGVSRATVSYVLNDVGNQRITDETRDRVRAAAAKLGYRPHAGARALRRGHSDVVLLPAPAGPLGQAAATAIEQCALTLAERGLSLVVDVSRLDSEQATVEAWLKIQPVAVVEIVPMTARLRQALAGTGLPVISLVGDSFHEDLGATQVRYLRERGHRHLAVASTADPVLAAMAEGRRRGVLAACAGLPEPAVEILPLTAGAADAAVDRWLARPEPPTAVCAYNDEVAVAILGALARRGVAVPGAMAVIGIDDVPMAAVVEPALTTVTWSVASLGTAVAEAVWRTVAEPGAARTRFDPPVPVVVVRRSA